MELSKSNSLLNTEEWFEAKVVTDTGTHRVDEGGVTLFPSLEKAEAAVARFCKDFEKHPTFYGFSRILYFDIFRRLVFHVEQLTPVR